MIRLSHRTLIMMSGLLWFFVGFNLLRLGVNYLVESMAMPDLFFTHMFQSIGIGKEGSLLLIVLGLAIGYAKSRMIFKKTVTSTVQRVTLEPHTNTLSSVFTTKYIILLALMMALGMGLKNFDVPVDFRGIVDVAVGAALINGAIMYFRAASSLSVKTT